jgi:UDPglucose--hexose-1-phosphate uridylyltransferase
MLYRFNCLKPDGRALWLYARQPIDPLTQVPAPSGADYRPAAHLRYHPLLEEWVIYATHRQDRTFLPGQSQNPLAPSPQHDTELPIGNYDVAVFENRFPSLSRDPLAPPDQQGFQAGQALGACEVVVFDQDPEQRLGGLSTDRLELILEVWADRTSELQQAGFKYVLPFENRGAEIGATLTHPHGQIYAYGFVPNQQQRIAAALKRYLDRTGVDLVSELAAAEETAGHRLVCAQSGVVGFTPPFSRFPYEIWIAPKRAVSNLIGLSSEERSDFANVLSDCLRRVDALWRQPMPYLLTVNQAPNDGFDHPEWTVNIQICPIRRAPGKLKFLAGTEIGAGVFVSDVSPESAAIALRGVDL